jgi:hypothetical protein
MGKRWNKRDTQKMSERKRQQRAADARNPMAERCVEAGEACRIRLLRDSESGLNLGWTIGSVARSEFDECGREESELLVHN